MQTGSFIWYELLTSDPGNAIDFYSHVVGWGAQDSGNPHVRYTLLTVNDIPVAGAMSTADAQMDGVPPMWSGHIMVEDLDGHVERLRQAGGTVHMEPMDIPDTGRFAIVADPNGASFQLFEPSRADRGDYPAPLTPGTIGWHDLQPSNWDKAFAFYSSLFGWSKDETIDAGPMGSYHMFRTGGDFPVGGMMDGPSNENADKWRYYINVGNIDAALERVREKGGTIASGPDEVPGGQWVAQGRDPQNAWFGLVGTRD